MKINKEGDDFNQGVLTIAWVHGVPVAAVQQALETEEVVYFGKKLPGCIAALIPNWLLNRLGC